MSKKNIQPQINKNLDIFIYSHIPFRPVVSNPVYKILTCSHENFPVTKLKLYRDYKYDDTLSDNNLMWNEYSGIHAMAYDPNIHLKKYVGMNHYRRYFYWLDNVPDMETMFENFDIVLGKPVYFHENMNCDEHDYDVMSQYGYWHNVRDLMKVEEIIKDLYPEMAKTVDKVFYENNYLFNSFMSIWRTDDFFEYADFAFDILETVCDEYNCHTTQEWIDYTKSHYDWYHKQFSEYYSNLDGGGGNSRVIGFLAERVCNVYLHHKWDSGHMKGNSFVDKAALIKWGMIPEEQWKV